MLSDRETQVLKFICDYHAANGGVSPSMAQIAHAIGIRCRGASVMRLLDGLEQRGIIRRMQGKWRAIEVLRKPCSKPVYFRFDDATQELQPVPS